MQKLNSKKLIINRLFRDQPIKDSTKLSSKNLATQPTQNSSYESFVIDSHESTSLKNPSLVSYEEYGQYFRNFNEGNQIGYRPINKINLHRPLKRNLLEELLQIRNEEYKTKLQCQKRKSSVSGTVNQNYTEETPLLQKIQNKSIKQIKPTTIKLNPDTSRNMNKKKERGEPHHEYFDGMESLQFKRDRKQMNQKAAIQDNKSFDFTFCHQKLQTQSMRRPLRILRQPTSVSIQNIFNRRKEKAEGSQMVHQSNINSIKVKRDRNRHYKSSQYLLPHIPITSNLLTNVQMRNYQTDQGRASQQYQIDSKKSQERLSKIRMQLHKVYSDRYQNKDRMQNRDKYASRPGSSEKSVYWRIQRLRI